MRLICCLKLGHRTLFQIPNYYLCSDCNFKSDELLPF